jgi:D-alanyl-D-alanine carboxypeptidase (penicillin-binding protein 5/6)
MTERFMNKHLLLISIITLLSVSCFVWGATALEVRSAHPYTGAIVVDAASGKVLFEDDADRRGYPASVVKLMVLFVVLDAVESRHLTLDEPVTVTAEAARIGGSQVYLKENEMFTVDELLYALIVQSANDAATALAIHFAGSKQAFVGLMNQRAKEIGMRNTVFHSVHGLPPGRGQLPDVSTARDIARLCRELVKRPDVLKYTSTRERVLRQDAPEPFIMRSHNNLLKSMTGCDGLKTGFFNAGGFSIAATASKNDQRAIAVVLGSVDRKVRDAKAREILSEGLMKLVMNARPSKPAASAAPQNASVQGTTSQQQVQSQAPAKAAKSDATSDVVQIKKSTVKTIGLGVGGLLVLGFVLVAIKKRNRNNDLYAR